MCCIYFGFHNYKSSQLGPIASLHLLLLKRAPFVVSKHQIFCHRQKWASLVLGNFESLPVCLSFFSFQYSRHEALVVNFCQFVDSNFGSPLVTSEVIVLQTEPQPQIKTIPLLLVFALHFSSPLSSFLTGFH